MVAMEKYIEIGNRLRQLRASLSQKEFAASIGVPFRTYQRYESGERLPKGDALQRIALVCAVPIEWIMTGNSPPEISREDVIKAVQKRDKNLLLLRHWWIIEDVLKRVDAYWLQFNTPIGLPDDPLPKFIKSYNKEKNSNITLEQIREWGHEVLQYNELLKDWSLNNYYPYKRGEIKKNHPFVWTFGPAKKKEGATEVERRPEDPRLEGLLMKLERIYKEGDFDKKARLRGTIDELYDEIVGVKKG